MKNNKGNSLVVFIIIIFIAVILLLILNNVYIKYNTINLDTKDYQCQNNNIVLKENDVSKYGIEFRSNAQDKCLQECRGGKGWHNYFKEKEIVYCDNESPKCDCKTSFYTYYISPLF